MPLSLKRTHTHTLAWGPQELGKSDRTKLRTLRIPKKGPAQARTLLVNRCPQFSWPKLLQENMVKPVENCSLRDATFFLAPLLGIKPEDPFSFPRSLILTHKSPPQEWKERDKVFFFLALHYHNPLPLAKIFWAEKKLLCLLLFDVLQNLVVTTPAPGQVEAGRSAWHPAVSQYPLCRVEFCAISEWRILLLKELQNHRLETDSTCVWVWF